MIEYTATVTREGKWWMVHIPAVEGLTQARRLSEAELMAREFIAAALDVPLESVAVDIEVDAVGPVTDINSRLARIKGERAEAARLEHQATNEAAELARSLVEAKIPLRDVGTILGVSHQRAHQLVTS